MDYKYYKSIECRMMFIRKSSLEMAFFFSMFEYQVIPGDDRSYR